MSRQYGTNNIQDYAEKKRLEKQRADEIKHRRMKDRATLEAEAAERRQKQTLQRNEVGIRPSAADYEPMTPTSHRDPGSGSWADADDDNSRINRRGSDTVSRELPRATPASNREILRAGPTSTQRNVPERVPPQSSGPVQRRGSTGAARPEAASRPDSGGSTGPGSPKDLPGQLRALEEKVVWLYQRDMQRERTEREREDELISLRKQLTNLSKSHSELTEQLKQLREASRVNIISSAKGPARSDAPPSRTNNQEEVPARGDLRAGKDVKDSRPQTKAAPTREEKTGSFGPRAKSDEGPRRGSNSRLEGSDEELPQTQRARSLRSDSRDGRERAWDDEGDGFRDAPRRGAPQPKPKAASGNAASAAPKQSAPPRAGSAKSVPPGATASRLLDPEELPLPGRRGSASHARSTAFAYEDEEPAPPPLPAKASQAGGKISRGREQVYLDSEGEDDTRDEPEQTLSDGDDGSEGFGDGDANDVAQPDANEPRFPCHLCSRKFVRAALAKHQKICQKVFQRKRKAFKVRGRRAARGAAARHKYLWSCSCVDSVRGASAGRRRQGRASFMSIRRTRKPCADRP
jgi:hypothetical protein